jgi:hypothetical protein
MWPCIVNVFLSTTNKMQRYTILFIAVSTLHVSSDFPAHHQELKNCTCSMGYLSSLFASTTATTNAWRKINPNFRGLRIRSGVAKDSFVRLREAASERNRIRLSHDIISHPRRMEY